MQQVSERTPAGRPGLKQLLKLCKSPPSYEQSHFGSGHYDYRQPSRVSPESIKAALVPQSGYPVMTVSQKFVTMTRRDSQV